MKTLIEQKMMYGRTFVVLITSVFLLAACATGPKSPDGAAEARSKLTAIQEDPEMANRARVEIREAEEAVKLAEEPLSDSEAALGSHRVYMAEQKVEIARATATTKKAEDERDQFGEQRSDARLEARTREADRARADAAEARSSQADMQRRMEELEAEQTERGMVVTLGDVLFDTGSAQLRGRAGQNLDKLAGFMNQYPDHRLLIEGHTDNVGSAAYNKGLSEQRAESVRQYLTQRGVASNRITVAGIGLQRPVASNDSEAGRQQNRRVEVVIEDPPATR